MDENSTENHPSQTIIKRNLSAMTFLTKLISKRYRPTIFLNYLGLHPIMDFK